MNKEALIKKLEEKIKDGSPIVRESFLFNGVSKKEAARIFRFLNIEIDKRVRSGILYKQRKESHGMWYEWTPKVWHVR